MKIKLLCVGKNNNSIWFDSMEHYSKRINQYVNFSIEYIPDVKTGKKSNPELVKNEEAKKLLLKIKKDDVVILLDENGKAFSSKAFAETVENHQNMGVRNLVFIIGGAFGFSENIYLTFDKKIRLSDMTFSHQMIRLFFCEQLYRAYTIIHKPSTDVDGTFYRYVQQYNPITGCASPMDTATITIYKLPIAPFTQIVDVCEGSADTSSPIALASGILHWYESDSITAISGLPMITGASLSASKNYLVRQEDTNGCYSPFAVAPINLLEKPDIAIQAVGNKFTETNPLSWVLVMNTNVTN